MSTTKDFVIGVAIGSAVGAAAALLYAPQSGAETRQYLGEKADEAKLKGQEYAGVAREKCGEMMDTTKQKAAALAETATAKVRESTEGVRARAGAIVDDAKETLDKGKGMVERQAEAVKSAVEAGKQAYTEKSKELHETAGSTAMEPVGAA
jgi:gas vesicle protein